MRRALLPLLLAPVLAGCASTPDDDFVASDPATLDCPALARQLIRSDARLRQLLAANPNIDMNIGLGSSIGSHGAIGVLIPLPMGQLRTPSQEAVALEQYQSRLRQWQQQRHCPEALPKTP
ncbi:hypothetical protein [Vogesella sp. LIG4]|uniref:hypothetical protein n=1 Tax=Vogesella sp. LIG4 TaxID=1192162 RepID=UPI00081FD668|nr:hypothetical protein [Vogesella sp. LIG4]SCK09990.1 hypothetical protein PSELUDRAFT_0710 [Vogesella sp. LIG4]